MDINYWFTAHFDNGGLVYPTHALSKAVMCMEDALTSFFSKYTLHEESLADFGRELRSVTLPKLGCPEHESATRLSVVKFYVLLRLRFYVKGLNKDRDAQMQRKKLLKLRHG